MKGTHVKMIIVAAIVLLFFGMQQAVPKEAISDVDGQACTESADCPCYGDMGDNEFGIGTSLCKSGVCDTTYCFNVQPVEQWVKDNPLAWIKSNILMTLALIVLAIVVITWKPKT